MPMLKKAFGDSIESLIEIQGLATAPEHQGKGYGTALMLLVNALVGALPCLSMPCHAAPTSMS